MEETLNTALVAIINSAASAQEFLLREIPDVLRQLILFNIITQGAYLLIAVGLIALSIVVGKKTVEKGVVDGNGDPTRYFFPLAASLIVGASSLLYILKSLTEFLKITIAPKVWLIEYAAALVR